MKLTVIGAGTMGRGIAETAASHGLSVCSIEVNPAQQASAREQMRLSIEKGINRGRVTGSVDEVLSRLTFASSLDAAADAEFVVEAIHEDEALKTEIFQKLDRVCRPDVILASNTSSISISRLAAATGRPDRVVGMHFFNPVPVMAPVEVVRGEKTSDATVQTTKALAEKLGKQALVVNDRPGFVVNRVLMPLINEAVWALHLGVAEATAIDSLVKLGLNHPMGPLELADLIGLDVCLSILHVLHRDLKDDKFRPCPLLEEKVAAGKLGRKSGAGFFEYGAK